MMVYTPNELKANDNNSSNNVVIIRKFRTGTRIREHDFMSVKAKKEQASIIICLTCNSLYCGKCGKSLIIIDQNYMQNNIYN